MNFLAYFFVFLGVSLTVDASKSLLTKEIFRGSHSNHHHHHDDQLEKKINLNNILPSTPHHRLHKELNIRDKKIRLNNLVDNFPTNPTYVVLEAYNDATCSNSMGGLSFLLDSCFSAGQTSLMISCANNQVTVNSYSDDSCATLDNGASFNGTGCFSDFGASLKVIGCGTSSGLSFNSASIAIQNFQDAMCSELISASFVPNGECIADPTGTVGSLKIDWPSAYAYKSTDCSGTTIGIIVVPQICTYDPTGTSSSVPTTDVNANSYSELAYVAGASMNYSWTVLTFLLAIAVGMVNVFTH